VQIDTDSLIETLKTSFVHVNFTKLDGTQREMKCTLKQSHLPASIGGVVSGPNRSGAISVWDLDRQAWRSFRLDRVNTYNPIEDSVL